MGVWKTLMSHDFFFFFFTKRTPLETSLAIQLFGVRASNAGGGWAQVQSLVGELRSHMVWGMARNKI